MRRYLLDTNVLLHVVNGSAGHERIVEKLSSTPRASMAVSAVTVWEIARMVERAKAPARASRAALDMLSNFRQIPMTKGAAYFGGLIYARLSDGGNKIGDRDTMIAGIALAHGYILVTDNTREFHRVPGLTVENWRVG